MCNDDYRSMPKLDLCKKIINICEHYITSHNEINYDVMIYFSLSLLTISP